MLAVYPVTQTSLNTGSYIENTIARPLDGSRMESSLKKAQVPVERKEYEGAAQEFFGTAAVVAKAKEAQGYAGQRLRQAFGDGAAN